MLVRWCAGKMPVRARVLVPERQRISSGQQRPHAPAPALDSWPPQLQHRATPPHLHHLNHLDCAKVRFNVHAASTCPHSTDRGLTNYTGVRWGALQPRRRQQQRDWRTGQGAAFSRAERNQARTANLPNAQHHNLVASSCKPRARAPCSIPAPHPSPPHHTTSTVACCCTAPHRNLGVWGCLRSHAYTAATFGAQLLPGNGHRGLRLDLGQGSILLRWRYNNVQAPKRGASKESKYWLHLALQRSVAA